MKRFAMVYFFSVLRDLPRSSRAARFRSPDLQLPIDNDGVESDG